MHKVLKRNEQSQGSGKVLFKVHNSNVGIEDA